MIGTRLQRILDRQVHHKRVFGVAVSVRRGDGSASFDGGSGNLTASTPFFIASTTKLFTTALVMMLRNDGKLSLNDTLPRYFDAGELEGLHVYKRIEYSRQISIRHLLSHTSGLPDYFQQERDGRKLMKELFRGADQHWQLPDILRASTRITPKFAPGAKRRAFYSDTNFQLLGETIARVAGLPFAKAVEDFIARPLGLRQTYVYVDPHDQRPMTLYFKNAPLHVPRAMSSFGPDGGMVSTAMELMTFLRHFFSGTFFPVEYVAEMTREWNRIFYPLEYGLGVARFSLPRILSLFQQSPELIGHSGLSGAFAWYLPAQDVYITGTVNQLAIPRLSFQLVLKLSSALDEMEAG